MAQAERTSPHPLRYTSSILFTMRSGITASEYAADGIVRDQAGHSQALVKWTGQIKGVVRSDIKAN
jgi:hypothetical protein